VYAIVATPAEIPVTIPVTALTLATPVELLLQTPPGVASAKADVVPTQTDVMPTIADGAVETVKG
jgi:hypothetical protein